jgi:hypothetical protein
MWLDIRNGILYHPCWATPRQHYHRGEMLYGRDYKLASHSPRLFHHVEKYGLEAFF